MTSICDLPVEIVVKIFRYYLETEQQSSLKRIFRACSSLKYLEFDPVMWTSYDGSLTFREMMQLCKKECFKNTKYFKFSVCTSPKPKNLKLLFSNLIQVNVIDFSNVESFPSTILTELGSSCPNVREIKFADLKVTVEEAQENGYDVYSKTKLKYDDLLSYLSLRGSVLLSINLSYCIISKFTLVIRCIADCCPNLKELNLCYTGVSNPFVPSHMDPSKVLFHTDYVQKKCPKLKVLHLDCQVMLTTESHTEGFPNLEEFSFYDPNCKVMFDQQLRCILFNSSCLKSLNLFYCKISTDALCSLPACNLEILRISKCEANDSDNLHEVMKKWCHSLKYVDVSCSVSKSLNDAVLDLAETSTSSQLQELNLSYTRVEAEVICKILQRCPKLNVLKLESCRNLSRGMKKVYIGKSELNVLKEKVECFIN